MQRDPRIDPQPGDRICLACGGMVTVERRDDDRVEWVYQGKNRRVRHRNGWTLRGWIKVVCNGATVIDAAMGKEG